MPELAARCMCLFKMANFGTCVIFKAKSAFFAIAPRTRFLLLF